MPLAAPSKAFAEAWIPALNKFLMGLSGGKDELSFSMGNDEAQVRFETVSKIRKEIQMIFIIAFAC